MRRAAVALAVALVAPHAEAAPVVTKDFPCPGCLVEVPADASAERPVPLLVVLHGDEGSPHLALVPWRKVADEARVALLAPRCPTAKGCGRSWWEWNGDPAWLDEQVAAVEAAHPIAKTREYLAGWSGGASYLGLAAGRLSTRWAAISLSGGGIPADACPVCPRPTVYLAGDRNPLFKLTERTRERLEACGVPVAWNLLPGRDHAGELAELSRPARAKELLAFLLRHEGTCAPKPTTPAASIAPPAVSAAPPRAAPATEDEPAPPPAPPAAGPVRSCGCEAAGPTSGGAVGAVGIVWLLRRRTRRGRAQPTTAALGTHRS